MLPPINLATTDLVEFSPEMSADSGFYRVNTEFQASLGEVMGVPITPEQLQLAIEPGQTLPPTGNELPVETLMLSPEQVIRARNPDIPVIADERTEDADDLALVSLSNEARDDVADEGVVAIESSLFRSLHGDNARQPGDVPSAGRVRDQIQAPLAPRNVPVFEGQAATRALEQLANQQIDADARAAGVERSMSSDAIDAARYTANAVSTNLRPLAEKFEVLQKRVDAIVSQSSIVATDSLASLQGAHQTARVAPPPLIPASIDIPVQDDGWGEALNERVLWMAGKSIQRAEIRMNPAELGPIRVEVSVVDDVATVTFNAQHAVTREAIELAMPRLREMLGENGISLANPDISDADGSHEGHAGDNDALHGPSLDTSGVEDGEDTMTTSLESRSTSALVDTFV